MSTPEIIIASIAFLGALLCLIAGVGMLRMPDFYLRMSVTTKAATLGIGLFMLCAALYFDDKSVGTKVVAIILFTFLTAPISAHLLGRAAYILGVPMWKKSVVDDMKGQYRSHASELASDDPQSKQHHKDNINTSEQKT